MYATSIYNVGTCVAVAAYIGVMSTKGLTLSSDQWRSQRGGGGRGPGPHRNLTTKFLQTMKSMKRVQLTESEVHKRIRLRVRVTRGCDFGAKFTRNCLAAAPGPAGGAHSAAPDSLAEFRGGEIWQRKTAGQREGERVRKEEKGGCEGK